MPDTLQRLWNKKLRELSTVDIGIKMLGIWKSTKAKGLRSVQMLTHWPPPFRYDVPVTRELPCRRTEHGVWSMERGDTPFPTGRAGGGGNTLLFGTRARRASISLAELNHHTVNYGSMLSSYFQLAMSIRYQLSIKIQQHIF